MGGCGKGGQAGQISLGPNKPWTEYALDQVNLDIGFLECPVDAGPGRKTGACEFLN